MRVINSTYNGFVLTCGRRNEVTIYRAPSWETEEQTTSVCGNGIHKIRRDSHKAYFPPIKLPILQLILSEVMLVEDDMHTYIEFSHIPRAS